jgi:hypothetical protein
VIEDPRGLEAELLGLAGELDRTGPGASGIPPVVFALPALGNQDTDIHANLLAAAESYARSGIEGRDDDPRQSAAG